MWCTLEEPLGRGTTWSRRSPCTAAWSGSRGLGRSRRPRVIRLHVNIYDGIRVLLPSVYQYVNDMYVTLITSPFVSIFSGLTSR